MILHSQQQACAGMEAARYADIQAVKTSEPVGTIQQIYFVLQWSSGDLQGDTFFLFLRAIREIRRWLVSGLVHLKHLKVLEEKL